MKRAWILLCLSLTLGAVGVACANGTPHQDSNQSSSSTKADPPTDRRSVTRGSVTIDGKAIQYTATAGTLVLKNKHEKPFATMSYVAYVKRGVKNSFHRPITFLYNGGPGSSTVWLHMLAFGPERVVVGNGTMTPPAPYRMVNNDNSLLDVSDLVFIDAPGTGFGRVIGKDRGGVGKPEDVFGYDEDAKAFAQFITRYLTINSRWNSPKFLFGESYGTTRSAILADILETRDSVELNGVMLLSMVLDRTMSVNRPKIHPGINISYVLGLPSYAATAWYHHKLPQRPARLKPFLEKVEQFAVTDYARALMLGSELGSAAKQKIAEKLHQYTGLSTAYILRANLRVAGSEFSHELLSEEGKVTGRLDSRYSGPALDPMGQSSRYDPMGASNGAPTVAWFNQYMRNTLNFGEGMRYKVHASVARIWNYKHQPPGASHPLPYTRANVMPDLASAMKHDPNLKILLMGGYFDLGTPFYTAIYEMHQLPIQARLQKNISYAFFPSGHMVYLDPESHDRLHAAAAAFINANNGR